MRIEPRVRRRSRVAEHFREPDDDSAGIGRGRDFAERLESALTPPTRGGPVRTLADMTPEEVAAIEARYGAKVKR